MGVLRQELPTERVEERYSWEDRAFTFWNLCSGALTPSVFVDSIILVGGMGSRDEYYPPFSPRTPVLVLVDLSSWRPRCDGIRSLVDERLGGRREVEPEHWLPGVK